MGLRARVVLILTIPTVLAVGAHGALRVYQQEVRRLAEDREDLEITARAIRIAVENALRDRQVGDARRLLVDMVEQQEVIDRIRLFDGQMRPILVSNPLTIGEAVPSGALRQIVASGEAEVFYEAGPPSLFYYLAPLRGTQGAVEGAMEIVRLRTGADRRRQAAVLDVVARLGILIVVIVTTTVLAMQRQVLHPIAALTGALRRFGRDQAVIVVPVDRRDEVGQAAEAFNEMAVQLDAARARLQAETERVVELEHHLRRTATLAVAGRLASALAHEVGTPLNIVSGRAEVVLRALPPGDPTRGDLQVIVEQIDRITRIINSLLDTVRPHRPELRPTRVADVVEPLLPLLRYAARQRHVTLEADLAPALAPMLADASQLQQVLINLVVNAVEATPAGGRVTVRATPQVRAGITGVTLAVVDTGSGIAPEHLPRLFEPFFTTRPRGQGTGLGLAISREIVRAHRGEIDVETSLGEGTTMTAWIPAAPDGA